jgi:uncharacterized protein (TIGR02466 family)
MKRDLTNSERQPLVTVQVFPTRLHAREAFLGPQQAEQLSQAAVDKADLEDLDLKGAIIDFGISVLAADQVDLGQYEALELTEAWFNVLQPGDHHWDHTHANHTLSGVIYLTDGCHTIFQDPRPAASVLSLTYKDAPPGQARTFIHSAGANSIVVFPSWLPHRVATTPRLRKSIGFNLFLRGHYGGRYSREQIVL